MVIALHMMLVFSCDPERLNDSLAYHHAKAVVDWIIVISDTAQHSFAKIGLSDFSCSITKYESEMQILLQVVQDHRRLCCQRRI